MEWEFWQRLVGEMILLKTRAQPVSDVFLEVNANVIPFALTGLGFVPGVTFVHV